MAIQPVDLGAPVTGVGGDDYRQAHTKINANFVEVGADIVALKAKDATQDTAINLKAVKTEVTTALGLKANVSDVNAKNATQDSAINLRATISSVDAKNATQDAAITAADNLAKEAIPKSEKGAANGVATLDVDGKISPLQIPTEQPIAWGNITGDIADQTDLGTAATKEVGVDVGQIPLVEDIPDLAKTPLTYTTTTVELPNLAVDSEGALKRSTTLLGTAATQNVGTAAGQVPLARDIVKIAGTHIDRFYASGDNASGDANNFEQGTVNYCMVGYCINHPFPYSLVKTIRSYISRTSIQIAQNYLSGEIRVRYTNNGSDSWSEWRPTCDSYLVYSRTTAAGANVVVDADGKLMRSTSSERYKDILAPLELDDARYADAMALKPIVYRSTADADNPAYHYYSFSAEELGAYDPAFTLWRETETVTDEDGNVTEQPLVERQAEGININALLAMSHAIAIKQDTMIKALEARIETLESK